LYAFLPAYFSQTLAGEDEDYYGNFRVCGEWEYEGVSTFGGWGFSS
jgi:hypothetical protein